MSTLPSPGPTTPSAAAHPTVAVRPATADDLARVAEIAAPFVRDTCVTFEEEVWDVPVWQRKLDDVTARGLPFLVADVDGTTRPDGTSDPVVAGYAYASAWRPKPAPLPSAVHSAPTPHVPAVAERAGEAVA